MVTSASLSGNNVDGNEGSYLNWQVVSQEIANNRSLINWQVGWRFATYSCRGLRLGHASVNGVTVYNDTDAGDGVHTFNSGHDHRPSLQTAAGSLWVNHNADGTRILNASVGMTGFSGRVSNGSGSWALPTIARFSTAPSMPIISSITSTSFIASFSDGSGGAPINSRQLGYSTSPTGAVSFMSSDGSDTISGLTPGTTYYIWAQTHNAAGYSPWSPMATATTLRVPDAPAVPVISDVTQISAVVTFLAPFDGGATITAYQVGYGTNSSAPTSSESATSPKTIDDLDPGIKYYFFVRAQNSVGWSAWSSPSNATTISGARVLVGLVWKNAIPYVRDGGVWKLAQPWVKVMGEWKQTQ